MGRRRRRLLSHRGLGAAGVLAAGLAWPRDARAEAVFSLGAHLTISFGADGARPGLGLDVRGALLTEDHGDECTPERHAGVGLFAQGTWMLDTAWRFSAGLHGGSEIGDEDPFPAWDLELGWTYRTAFGARPAGHGVHVGGLAWVAGGVDLSLRGTWSFLDEGVPELTVGTGLRLPGPFGHLFSSTCVVGRALRVRGRVVMPAVALGARRSLPARRPLAGAADPVIGRALAAGWLADARGEAASVPAFGGLARDLARLGAAPELVTQARRAARDEVRHARVCRRLARVHLGVDVALLGRAAPDPAMTWAEAARDAWRDGCLGEGAAARRAARAGEGCRDDVARRAQAMIARDEHGHGELAWSVLAESLARGGRATRDALAAELASEPPAPGYGPRLDLHLGERLTLAHGRPTARVADDAWHDTLVHARARAARLLDAAARPAPRALRWRIDRGA